MVGFRKDVKLKKLNDKNIVQPLYVNSVYEIPKYRVPENVYHFD